MANLLGYSHKNLYESQAAGMREEMHFDKYANPIPVLGPTFIAANHSSPSFASGDDYEYGSIVGVVKTTIDLNNLQGIYLVSVWEAIGTVNDFVHWECGAGVDTNSPVMRVFRSSNPHRDPTCRIIKIKNRRKFSFIFSSGTGTARVLVARMI